MLSNRRQGRILAGGSTVLLAVLMPAGVAHAAPAKTTTTCPVVVPFSSEHFSDSPRIDNEYLPMKPGTRLTYQGDVTAGKNATPHEVVFTVTNMTEVIDGVRTQVAYDVDSDN